MLVVEERWKMGREDIEILDLDLTNYSNYVVQITYVCPVRNVEKAKYTVRTATRRRM